VEHEQRIRAVLLGAEAVVGGAQKVPSFIALMPEKPCSGWPLIGVDIPVGRGADRSEMYDIPGIVPIVSTRRQSGPVYFPDTANDSGASLGGSSEIAAAGSQA
jgi:hypothetical protein